ncbi:MAG: TonB-dependent receptor [Candidatus Korobacteraceae bacterium]
MRETGITISGVVSDQTGASVARAKVDLVSTRAGTRSAATDGQGRYQFDGLQPGEYTIRITASGFQFMERRLTVTASEEAADFRLAVQPLRESVTVTAEALREEIELQRALTPGGVTVVDGDQLYQRNVNNLADMLRYVPGMWAESGYGNEELFFSSRGSNLDSTDYDKNGVKLLQDGLPVTSADGNNHNRVIDPLSARYATVARGANALTYGASTLGGAMDFTSPTGRSSNSPFSVFLNGGSFGSLNGRATLSGARDKVDGLVTVEGRRWGGYRDHSEQERWGIYANTGWQPSATTDLRLFATYLDNDLRLPGALTSAEVDADPNQASAAALDGNYGKVVKTGRLAVKGTKSFGANGVLTAGLSYEGQSLFHPIVNQIKVDFDGPGPNPPVEVFSLLIDTDHRDLGGMVRYDRRIGAHDLLVGLNYGKGLVTGGNYRNLNGQPNGISEYVDNNADSMETFMVDRWHVSERLTLVFGAQGVTAGRNVRTTNATTAAVSNPNDRYAGFNPRVGFITSLSRAGEVYGNVSRLFEAPTTFQMQNDVLGGDATLDPMTGTVAEIGWRSTWNQASGTRWNWDITAYYARISDEILSMNAPLTADMSLWTNFDKTTHAGLEAFAGTSFSLGGRHRIEPQVSFTLNQFHFADDPIYGSNRLPAAPRYATRGEVLYRHARGFYAGPTFDFIGKRYADFANSYTVDSYGLMGLRAGISGERWELFGEIRNIFDANYIATVGVANVAAANARVLYPGAPVSSFVGMRFSF